MKHVTKLLICSFLSVFLLSCSKRKKSDSASASDKVLENVSIKKATSLDINPSKKTGVYFSLNASGVRAVSYSKENSLHLARYKKDSGWEKSVVLGTIAENRYVVGQKIAIDASGNIYCVTATRLRDSPDNSPQEINVSVYSTKNILSSKILRTIQSSSEGVPFDLSASISGTGAWLTWADIENSTEQKLFSYFLEPNAVKEGPSLLIGNGIVKVNNLDSVITKNFLVAAWSATTGPNTGVFASQLNLSADPKSWTPTQRLEPDLNAFQPSLSADADGKIMAAWLHTELPENLRFTSALFDPTKGWQATVPIEPTVNDNYWRSIAITSAQRGQFLSLWPTTGLTCCSVNESKNGAAWSTPKIVTSEFETEFGSNLVIAGDLKGRAYALWAVHKKNYYAMLSQRDPATGAWSTAKKMEENSKQSHFALLINPAGDGYFAIYSTSSDLENTFVHIYEIN